MHSVKAYINKIPTSLRILLTIVGAFITIVDLSIWLGYPITRNNAINALNQHIPAWSALILGILLFTVGVISSVIGNHDPKVAKNSQASTATRRPTNQRIGMDIEGGDVRSKRATIKDQDTAIKSKGAKLDLEDTDIS